MENEKKINLPSAYIEQIEKQLGKQEAQEYFLAIENIAKKSLRINTLHENSFYEPHKSMLQKFSFGNQLYYYNEKLKHGLYHECGAYYSQEASAMLPVLVLDAKPGENILDLCAAPGSKSTQIAEQMQQKGILYCNEINRNRANILSENIKRLGIKNAIILSMSPRELQKHFCNYFDAILVDAPCSGEGMFRKNSNAIDEWSLEHTIGCSIRQKEILDSAEYMLKPGGRLVYSTCTLNTAENEEVISYITQKHNLKLGEFKITKDLNSRNGMLKVWPHRFNGEGHFIAKLQKNFAEYKEQLPNIMSSSLTKADVEVFNAFCKERKIKGFIPNFKYNEYLMCIPTLSLKGLNLVDAGVRLGTIKNKLFFPNHSFAQAIHQNDVKYLSLDEQQAKDYLSGKTINCNISENIGFILLRYNGYNIGWGKINNGVIKNHYPKHLRKNI